MPAERDIARAVEEASRVLDAWLPLRFAYARVPGGSVGVVHRGKLVYARGFGLADAERQTPAAPSTAYRIASHSKMFTAVAVMQLVEQGRLALDDRIAWHLPWFKASAKGRDAQHVTIRHALSHIAGVFRDGDTPHWSSDEFPSAAQLRRSVSAATVVYENATRFKYSNFGFALVGAVVEKVTGTPYAEHLDAGVVRPLRMRRTAPDLTDASRAWLAAGYSRPIPGAERERFEHCTTNAYAPATGFLSTVQDMAKFVGALSLARNPRTLLARESRKELFRVHATTADGSYGLGFAVNRHNGHTLVGHNGGFAGFVTSTRLDLDDDVGVIVLTNSNDNPVGAVCMGIHDTIQRLAEPAAPQRTVQRPQRYEGTYRSRWQDHVVVAARGRLVAFAPQSDSPLADAATLEPAGADTFEIRTAVEFDSPGERARFVVPAGSSRATTLVWGSQRSDRV